LEEKPADPKALARAEAQRQRLREERQASVLAGLDDLDRWIADQLNLGLAGFASRAAQSAKTLSTRLVDAKAQGLAGRIGRLPPTSIAHRSRCAVTLHSSGWPRCR
jgi:hypothetical protein